MVTVNGEEKDLAGITVMEMLDKLQFNKDRVVVEVNLEIVPKSEHASRIIQDQDTIEVVSFVGGG